jgi:CheY-like chemotaxis protein
MLSKKILLAEDDADDRDFFCDFLKDRNDITLLPVVENGEEVFHFLATASTPSGLPDLIILDQNMPKKTGLQTLQMLKQNKSYLHIPVLIYSSYTDENLQRQSKALGAAMVYSKPSTPEGYHEMIDTALTLL